MTPNHLALAGYLGAVAACPIISMLLCHLAQRATQWINLGFALALFVVWLPLVASFDTIVAALA